MLFGSMAHLLMFVFSSSASSSAAAVISPVCFSSPEGSPKSDELELVIVAIVEPAIGPSSCFVRAPRAPCRAL